MKIAKTINEVRNILQNSRSKGKSIGFVPTMGALHKGHLALVNTAMQENDVVVVSIFVNPTQFNNPKDLEKYPRNLKADIALLQTLSSEIIVYNPTIKDLYGNSVAALNYDFGSLATVMEGAFRPGHFNGVATVVNKLFKKVKPNRAYFGEKDYQQLLIIKKLVALTNQDIEIVGCPIARALSGLARSSRNQRLNNTQLNQASFIYNQLNWVKETFNHKPISTLKNTVYKQFELREEWVLEYFEIAEANTLQPAIQKQQGVSYRAFIAAQLGGVRLIDNMGLN